MRRRILLGNSEPTVLTAIYTVTSTTSPTKIGGYDNYMSQNFKSIEIDGVKQSDLPYQYKFSTLGNHTVKYELKDKTLIGFYSFRNCENLISIDIPNSVTNIGSYAFDLCTALKRVNSDTDGECNIPNSVKVISYGCFGNCDAITSMFIPNSVTTINAFAFDHCDALKRVNSDTDGVLNLPSTVTSIYEYNPWRSCLLLTTITVDSENANYDSRGNCNAIINSTTNELVTGCINTVIPNTVTSIGGYAFYDNELISITIPNSVTNIGISAFANCDALKRVNSNTNGEYNIPDSITTIGNGAFMYCYGLTTCTLGSGVTSIDDTAFSHCAALKRVNSNTDGECNIPSGVISIGSQVFNEAPFTSINIPSSVTSIGVNPWMMCANIVSITVDGSNTKYDSRGNCNAIINSTTNELVTGCKNTVIPNTVTKIGNDCFYHCSGLTSITIPNSVTSIGNAAFYRCGLTSIEIPSGVTSIGQYAFSNCNSLSSVTVRATTPPTLANGVFNANASGRKIYVPSASVDTYKAASGWSSYASYIEPIP